ncbi:bifunctional helix-turn-helix transcriptional regulator/GNAT family N-acetyltransferase [Nocardioides speluncae]|uniref:bifunctional helix-turn-helix transcriptional regulator/GNAT family N-acetyltransferase n=1 Tax=Nocardioides speluncae TaxID=2670337 RepID=UPI000D69E05E|nr:helix-turn-helix domain-containing GNAT family N-acetyltransferase [Nocardioides speluncae]
MSQQVTAERVARVRAFNRFYTDVIGVLRGTLLDSPFTLTEARVLFELAHGEAADVASLRADADIDRGHLSRVLTRLEADDLVRRTRSEADSRRQVVELTDKGRAAAADLDGRSVASVTELLEPIAGPEQERLLAAMATIEELLGKRDRSPGFTVRPARPGDHGWIVERHGALYRSEYGYDEQFEGMVAQIMADLIEAREDPGVAVWVAEQDGVRVGAICCARDDEETARLRCLLVEPTARGAGIGRYLVDECLRFARQAGYRRMVLYTHEGLDAARRAYERVGFTLEAAVPQHAFGTDVVEQTWALDLRSPVR